MSEAGYRKCDTCGKAYWVDRYHGHHVCPPEWEYRETMNFGEDEWEKLTYRFSTAEYAACDAAQRHDSEEYYLLRNQGETIEIHVRQIGTDKVYRFMVHGESLPHYYANEIEDEPEVTTEEKSSDD